MSVPPRLAVLTARAGKAAVVPDASRPSDPEGRSVCCPDRESADFRVDRLCHAAGGAPWSATIGANGLAEAVCLRDFADMRVARRRAPGDRCGPATA